jgi:RHS repeat-associated protein
MFSLSPRKLYSLWLGPSLLVLLFTITPDTRRPNSLITQDATYTVHRILNGTFPFADPVRLVSTGPVSHGTLRTFGSFNGFSQDSFIYEPANGFVGNDSFTYHACDSAANCVDGAINLNVVNNAPNAVDDSYTLHVILYGGGDFPLTYNDSDADGDPVRLVSITQPAHGRLSYFFEYDSFIYEPNLGFVGTDTVTYQACDSLDLCDQATVTFNVVNNAPLAGDDQYNIYGITTVGPLRLNDSDPDQVDTLYAPTVVSQPSHGAITASSPDGDMQTYQPNQGYLGADSFVYRVCDNVGLCSNATVTLRILPNDQRENSGSAACHATVGAPVNVTNGNMYLQQADYLLPGVGPAINITRTYNSNSTDIGLFGRGWASAYDEGIRVYGSTFVRWFRADGQATNFTRSSGSGPFASLEGDFHGSLIQNGDGSFTLSFKEGSVHRFSSNGKLLSLTDTNSNQTTLTYVGSKLASITDPFGRIVTATTDASGKVLTLTDRLGKFATYVYGGSSELLSVTYADNSKYQFAYATANSNLVLATVTDALGNILENHTYDGQGRAIKSEKHGGVERYNLNFVSEAETDVTDALGRVTKYILDKTKGRNLVTQLQGLCSCGGGSQTQTWTYDSQMNMTSHTNGLGQTVTYVYDSSGNQLSGTSVLGTSTFTYNQRGQVLTATDAMNGTAGNIYDGAGNPVSITDALNNTTAFTYNSRGQLLTMTNARGKVTTLVYDASGNIAQTTDALGNVTKLTYDARGRLKTSFAYDAAGRLNKVTRADNSTLTFTYDLAGRRTQITDPLRFVTSFAYDSAYRLIGETDALGKSVSFGYDLMSNLVATTDQLGHATNISYDEFNRPIKITYPPTVAGGVKLEETVFYDGAGNVTSRTDSAGRVTTFGYDGANRLISITDPLHQVTQYEYDARSNVTAVIDPLGQRYAFEYDALSRPTVMTRAGLQMSYVYDAAGDVTQRTDHNNMTTNYTHDALNRLTRITYPDGSTSTYVYDKLSQVTSATNSNGTVSLVYDKLRRLTSTTDVWGQVINYAYDANDRRTEMAFGNSRFASYAYDSVNRLTKITDNANKNTTYTYDAEGKLVTRSLSNGVISTLTYDGMHRLIRLSDAQGSKKNVVTVADNNYTYNNASQIVQNVDLAGTHTYGYDALDRLTSASYPLTGNESYAFDSTGNRTSSQRSSNYSYQQFNRLMSTDSASFLYDNNGNLTSRNGSSGATQFAWDFENRLTNAVTPAAGSVSYKYDALGRRIQRTPSTGVSTNFTYDGDEVVRDRNSDGSSVDYLNGAGVDNKIWQKGVAQYFFTRDHLGSTTALTSSSGAVVERENYDSFGNTAGSNLTRYGFTGRERDSVTGLMYYRARWYDPQVGRFISEDPIGLRGGINQFAYVGNNPENRVDPSGLYEIDVHYYLTYFLALKTGCFTDAEARLIADADQSTDENENTSPGPGFTSQQRRQNRDFHDLKPGNREGFVADDQWNEVLSGATNYVALGRYLHFLQDSFSHTGFESDVFGHLARLHYYDKTDSDVPRAMRMAAATWEALNRYASEKKCSCRGDWDIRWWQQVLEFSRAPGANLGLFETIDSRGEIENFGMTNHPIYLGNKITILGLTYR